MGAGSDEALFLLSKQEWKFSPTGVSRLPLSGAKRTSKRLGLTSAYDPGCVKTPENGSNYDFGAFFKKSLSMKSMA